MLVSLPAQRANLLVAEIDTPQHVGSKVATLKAPLLKPGMNRRLVHANSLHHPCNCVSTIVPSQPVGSQATFFDVGQSPFLTQIPDVLGSKRLAIRRAIAFGIQYRRYLTVSLLLRM